MCFPASQVFRVHNFTNDRPRVVETTQLNITLGDELVFWTTAARRLCGLRALLALGDRRGRRRIGGRHSKHTGQRGPAEARTGRPSGTGHDWRDLAVAAVCGVFRCFILSDCLHGVNRYSGGRR